MDNNKIDIVKDRLILIEHLSKAEEHFKGRLYRRESNPYEVQYPLYKNYHGLKIYLALTCFDILGQTEEWLDFNSWLICKKINIVKERNSIIDNIVFCNPPHYIVKVQNEYNKLYGVKNSFFYFVNHIISEENRNILFESISNQEIISESKILEDGTYIPAIGGGNITLTDELKLKFLFQLRNSFTHKGIAYGTDIGATFDINSYDELRDNKPIYHSFGIHVEKIKGKTIVWCVRRWPFLLEKILNETLNTIILKRSI